MPEVRTVLNYGDVTAAFAPLVVRDNDTKKIVAVIYTTPSFILTGTLVRTPIGDDPLTPIVSFSYSAVDAP